MRRVGDGRVHGGSRDITTGRCNPVGGERSPPHGLEVRAPLRLRGTCLLAQRRLPFPLQRARTCSFERSVGAALHADRGSCAHALLAGCRLRRIGSGAARRSGARGAAEQPASSAGCTPPTAPAGAPDADWLEAQPETGARALYLTHRLGFPQDGRPVARMVRRAWPAADRGLHRSLAVARPGWREPRGLPRGCRGLRAPRHPPGPDHLPRPRTQRTSGCRRCGALGAASASRLGLRLDALARYGARRHPGAAARQLRAARRRTSRGLDARAVHARARGRIALCPAHRPHQTRKRCSPACSEGILRSAPPVRLWEHAASRARPAHGAVGLPVQRVN